MLMKQIHSKPCVGKRLGRYICWWTKRSLGYHQHSGNGQTNFKSGLFMHGKMSCQRYSSREVASFPRSPNLAFHFFLAKKS